MSEIYILSIIFGDNDRDDCDTDDNIINLYYSKSIKKVEKMKEQLLNMFDKSKFYKWHYDYNDDDDVDIGGFWYRFEINDCTQILYEKFLMHK